MEDKIAIYLPSMRGGGAERQMRNLAEGFIARGLSVDLVLAKAEGPYLKTIPDGVHLVDLGASRVIYSLPGLVRYLRRVQPKAMLSAMSHANMIAIVARKLARVNTRLVISERNTPSVQKHTAAFRRGRLLPRIMRFVYPGADAIVAVSNGVKQDLKKRIGVTSPVIKVIYNPVISSALYHQAEQILDHPWFKANHKVVLAVGRLNKQKDFTTLLKAFARVYRVTQARLMILGEGEERQHLQDIIDDLGLTDYVAMPGFVTNPYVYMKHASVFVLSSILEGLPGVLIEALALGTPVVSTDCPHGPDEILQSGKYGKLVRVGDSDALADAIIAQLEQPNKYEKIDLTPYTSDTAIDSYLEVLTSCSET